MGYTRGSSEAHFLHNPSVTVTWNKFASSKILPDGVAFPTPVKDKLLPQLLPNHLYIYVLNGYYMLW
jgi:hypothetical protein